MTKRIFRSILLAAAAVLLGSLIIIPILYFQIWINSGFSQN